MAERVATLDLLSGGRVELGLGEGQGPVELHPFGARVREKREVWEEAVQALVPAFTQQKREWHGKYFDFPARNVAAEADAEAASAAVGGVLEHHRRSPTPAAGAWARSASSSCRRTPRGRG